jgi:hypothetical protein
MMGGLTPPLSIRPAGSLPGPPPSLFEFCECLPADAPQLQPMSQSFMAQTRREYLSLLQFSYSWKDSG